jgi:hypothetical protein
VFLLLVILLSTIGTAVWSLIDRRSTAHPRLAAGALVVLRYYLALTLLTYAFAKLAQFPAPTPSRLDQRVGDMSPMAMLWTFMGSSRPYALFGGVIEGLGGLLLLWRRGYVAGTLVGMAALSNVVMLNFCYDVPVKLYSAQLLLLSMVLFAPHARRIIGALLGRAVPEVPPRPRRSPLFERARLAAKVLVLAAMAFHLHRQTNQLLEHRQRPRHELHGVWVVDRLVLDGTERPPLTTDGERWHKLYLSQNGGGARAVDGPLERFGATVIPEERSIEIQSDPERPAGTETWRYALATDGDRTTLVLDGTFRGKRLHAELHREPDPLLVTRGFHWINEFPLNK